MLLFEYLENEIYINAILICSLRTKIKADALIGGLADRFALPYTESDVLCEPKVSHHFFVLSRILKLHNINLMQLYVWIVEIEYYIYISVQFEKLLNMKYNKKNKLQYEVKNDIKKDKMIITSLEDFLLCNRSLFIRLL
jgi:hypothetical protein